MIKILAYTLSLTLFWLGHFISRFLMWGWLPYVTYPVYNNLMRWSSVISDKYDLGIWEGKW